MSIDTLRTVLQQQADTAHAITVSAATLTQAGLTPRDGIDNMVRGHLTLGTANLTIGYSGQIPAPTADSLTLTGSATLLGATQAAVTVTFLVPASGGAADVRVAVGMPAGWTLGTAFPVLARPPFDGLALTSAWYVLTTAPQDSYHWNGTDRSLTQGSQLLSLLTLTGPLAVTGLLLGTPPGAVPLTGIVDPSQLASAADGVPALALTATLDGTVTVPGFSSADHQIEVTSPRIEVATGPGPAPGAGPRTWLAFATTLNVKNAPLCDFKMFILPGGGYLTFVMEPTRATPGRTFDPATMAALVHADYTVPQELQDLFRVVTLRGLSATISTGSTMELAGVAATIGSSGSYSWGQFTLDDLSLQLRAMAPIPGGPALISFAATASMFPEIFGKDSRFTVEAATDTASGDLVASAAFSGDIALSAIVAGLSRGQVTLPDGFDLRFEDFGIQLSKPSKGTADYLLWGMASASIQLPVLGSRVEADLQVTVDSAAHAYHLAGSLLLGVAAIGVTVNIDGQDTAVTGTWQAYSPAEYLGIDMLASALGLAAPKVPPQLDLGLSSAQLSYDYRDKMLALEADSVNYGKAAFVAGQDSAGGWSFVFGVLPSVEVKLDLTKIDVIGNLVATGDDIISLSNLRIVATSAALPAHPLPPAAEQIIGPLSSTGLMLSAELEAGTGFDDQLTVSFGTEQQNIDVTRRLPAAVQSTPVSPAPQAAWIDVQRAFGPVQFQRVGFTVTPDSELAILFDAAISLDGLTIGLTGLQAAMPVRAPYVPTFDLAGLQVQFNGGGVQIGGGLEKVPGTSPAEYTGDLNIQLAQFGVTAFGSYTTTGGKPSLFAFLFLDAPLGGPAFFFVTGLAGGFGYNRSLQLPAITGVADYPLVAGAMGKLDAASTQTQLNAFIQVRENENWLAAGVRFTSFEMLQSFALLTVAFGAQTEIGLLGESVLSVPTGAATPVALADMVVEVDVSPANGQLAVNAQLTPRSYVLDHAAHLSGGFAFYAWFAPSQQPGDFVVTLGGYNPYFTPPSHYPQQVPRLGLSWQVSDQLSVTGGLYFALTPSVLMAGGYLRATWNSGDLSAWFDAQADFLIRFKPFQYQITVSISIGVSFTLNLLVVTQRITIHLGVSLELHGPPFGGTATVDLSIFSFTIAFGAPPPKPDDNLNWTDFRRSFLPPANAAERRLSMTHRPPSRAVDESSTAMVTATDSLVTISAVAGQLGTARSQDATVYVVSPSALQISVTTQLPSTSASVVAGSAITPSGTWTQQLGVGPMGATAGALQSALTITITRGAAPDTDRWAATATTGGVPTGLYLSTTNQMQTDGTVSGALLGVLLTPDPPTGGSTTPVPVSLLLDDDPPHRDFTWSPVVPPDHDSFDQRTAMAQLQTSLTDPAVAQRRRDLLTALRAQGLPVAADVSVAGFAAAAPGLMAAPPQLRLLGEEVR